MPGPIAERPYPRVPTLPVTSARFSAAASAADMGVLLPFTRSGGGSWWSYPGRAGAGQVLLDGAGHNTTRTRSVRVGQRRFQVDSGQQDENIGLQRTNQ